jgi:hypothetical protein
MSVSKNMCDRHRMEDEQYGPSWHSEVCISCLDDKVDILWAKATKEKKK